METIKVKAWDEENEIMLYPSTDDIMFCFNENNELEVRYWNCDPRDINEGYWDLLNCEKIQYACVNDVDNREIYEGDIIESQGKPSPRWNGYLPRKYRYSKGHRKLIIFHDGAFKMTNKSKRSKKQYFSGMIIHRNSFKVIGNIYETPELWKQ